MDDRTCPHCGHDVALTETAPQRKNEFQFGLRFLFFLVGVTALACAVSKAVDSWLPAPLILVAALLFWRTRRDKFACLPGFVVGAAFLWLLMPSSPDPLYPVMDSMICGTLLAGVNAMLRGGYRLSGLVATIATMVYVLIIFLHG
jgi:hypothetical protein